MVVRLYQMTEPAQSSFTVCVLYAFLSGSHPHSLIWYLVFPGHNNIYVTAIWIESVKRKNRNMTPVSCTDYAVVIDVYMIKQISNIAILKEN